MRVLPLTFLLLGGCGLFGGTLDLQSALHEGTTIILKIPVYAPVP